VGDVTTTPGRNDPCRCGSGRKYKHCCLEKDEQKARAARAKAATKAPAPAEAAEAPPAKTRAPRTHQPWKRQATNTHPFHRVSTPRKVGGSG
jgi:hypothetical protein